jgi:hypothetical protein
MNDVQILVAAVWIGNVIGNFMFESFVTLNWSLARERSFFQFVTALVIFVGSYFIK